jgi:hypothetical protein
MNEQTKALVGAIEMLQLIGEGQNFSSIEFFERLGRYKDAALAVQPNLTEDPYFKRFFQGVRLSSRKIEVEAEVSATFARFTVRMPEAKAVQYGLTLRTLQRDYGLSDAQMEVARSLKPTQKTDFLIPRQ